MSRRRRRGTNGVGLETRKHTNFPRLDEILAPLAEPLASS